MRDAVINKITNSAKRKSFFHFTRIRNLPSIANLDALYSSNHADPALSNDRRVASKELQLHGHVFAAGAIRHRA